MKNTFIKTEFSRISIAKWLILFSAIIMHGCGVGGVDENHADRGLNAKTGNIQLPAILDTSRIPTGTTTTFLTIDNTLRQIIILTNNKHSLTLDDLPIGEHIFLIEIEFSSDKHPTMILATATIKMNINDGDNAINFNDTDFSYPDDNNDSESNLDTLKKEKSGLITSCKLGTSLLGNCLI